MQIALASAACALAACVLPASALGANDTTQFSVTAGSLSLSSAPDYPNLPSLTLNGQAQTLSAQMGNFTVADATGSGAGWNVTVQGNTAGGKSPVFKRWNGSSYGSEALAANSLTLNSTSAVFSAQSGSTGTAPTHSCNSGCFVDSASPTKLASAALNAGMGTYATSGYTATSLSLAAPTTVKAIGSDVYQVDLVTSVNSGP
jgi:hypothetical protein